MTCAGRRVELFHAFRRAASKLGLPLEVHAADASWLAPVMHLADFSSIVPRVDDASYVSRLLQLVRKKGIDMLVPLIDTDLPKLAAARDRFRKAGCIPLISSAEVVATCRDKIRTYACLKQAGIDTPETWTLADAMKRRAHRFPYFLKPRQGSASKGSFRIDDMDELRTLGKRVPDAIVQEFVPGIEHTLDVYMGLDGRFRCAVPRRRIEVRGGEVIKAVVVRDGAMIVLGARVAEALGDCMGVITIQLMVTTGGALRVIEVNPRFGGGVPLAIAAGADFPRWLLQEAMGQTPAIRPDGYTDGVVMLRFDDSVFAATMGKPSK